MQERFTAPSSVWRPLTLRCRAQEELCHLYTVPCDCPAPPLGFVKVTEWQKKAGMRGGRLWLCTSWIFSTSVLPGEMGAASGSPEPLLRAAAFPRQQVTKSSRLSSLLGVPNPHHFL